MIHMYTYIYIYVYHVSHVLERTNIINPCLTCFKIKTIIRFDALYNWPVA